jgi:addiction module RelE/StbE family toxin
MIIVYTDDAVDDLKRLKDFIDVHNPAAAARIARKLVEKIDMLSDHPKLGAPVNMAPDPESLRDMVFGKYVVRYSVHSHTVVILRVWHSLEDQRKGD